jgi:hypothetical protein
LRRSKAKKDESLDDMLKRLGIDGNGLHDLGFDKEMDVPKEGINYIALSRVHTKIATAYKPLNKA